MHIAVTFDMSSVKFLHLTSSLNLNVKGALNPNLNLTINREKFWL